MIYCWDYPTKCSNIFTTGKSCCSLQVKYICVIFCTHDLLYNMTCCVIWSVKFTTSSMDMLSGWSHFCVTTSQLAAPNGPTTVVKVSTTCWSPRCTGVHRSCRSSSQSCANWWTLSTSRRTGRCWAESTSCLVSSTPSIVWRWTSGAGCPIVSVTRHESSAFGCRRWQGLWRRRTAPSPYAQCHTVVTSHISESGQLLNDPPRLISALSALASTSCLTMTTISSDDVRLTDMCRWLGLLLKWRRLRVFGLTLRLDFTFL